MQLYFQPFYKLYGIRRLTQMMSPRLLSLPALPRDSVVHYLSDDPAMPFLDVSKPYFTSMGKPILVDYPNDLTSSMGNPTKLNTLIRPMVRDFHLRNKNFKFSPDAIDRIDDQTTLFALNYSFMDPSHRYAEVPLVGYFKFFNNYKSVFDRVSKISETKSKNHFIFVDLPKELPSYSMLNLASGTMTKTLHALFPTYEDLFIVQFWQWLSDADRDKTIFGSLKKEDLSKVNLVFHSEDGRSIVMNLGYMDSWLKGHASQEDAQESQKLKPSDFQKLFLKFMMVLKSRDPEAEVASDAEVVEENVLDHEDEDELRDIRQEEQEYLQEHTSDEDGDNVDQHEYSDIASNASNNKNKKPVEDFKKRQELIERDIDKSLVSNYSVADRLKEIDKDLVLLDNITSRRLKDKGIMVGKGGDAIDLPPPIEDIPVEVIRDKVYKTETYDEALRRQINDQAEYGLVSASDYKKLLADLEKYNASLDPYGTHQRTVEKMIVTPEDIKLDPVKTAIAVSPNLADQTMASSTLQAFDKDYLKHVYEKDMLGMVGNLQKAGLIVRRHEIEEDHSALGVFEHHTLEIKPIDGKTSVLRYKLPKVNEDGTFLANSNRYQLRKQKVDLPLRKVNPFTVAMTSYYGKTFVQMNQKKVNNSLSWIVKEMNKAGMDDAHPHIKRVGAANVFDNNFKAPYIYNAMANHFKSLITTKYFLSFDHTEREKYAPPELIARLEKGGGRVVGVTNERQPIIVTRGNNFEYYDGDKMVPIGDIYSVLELPIQNAPLDFTEVKVWSKAVPVGVILGYTIGFTNLLRLLDVKYRVVEGKRPGELEPHEYVIGFKDRKYILDRRNTTATLILAGFTDFDKQLKQYDVTEFNRKDVYLNLLESKGLSSMYIREIDLTQQLFVDPITKSILEQMGEPTTVNGLLIRATQMLETYHHPDSQDMSAQRIRGYERFPGAVYKEMVTQIRSFKNRNISGKSRVEMSPYQVWSSVMKDQALKLVEDINPIQNLKESEIVTYVGNGGRNKDAINKETRAYHIEDKDVISEATVDSSDVGVNVYLSANPNFEDMRGTIKSKKDSNPVNFLSTSALLSPGMKHDD